MTSAQRSFVASLSLFLAAWRAEPDPVAPRGGPGRRALIIAISHYGPDTEWHDLHTESDRAFMHAALEGQGFTAIDELRDWQATRAGVERALRTDLLGRAQPGDVVVVHFSGHGQQITDDNGDELDGYDEALVPYDAPKRPGPSYHGERHLRDDVFEEWMTELRRRVGPKGQVVAFLDACASGTPRGDEPVRFDLGPRRGADPFGSPQRSLRSRRGDELVGDFLDSPRGERPDGPAGLAPYVVISAARHDQAAFETKGSDGEPIGALSWALGLEFGASDSATTFRDLFERLKQRMARRVSNEPQIEGVQDQRLWLAGAVEQAPFFAVRPMRSGNSVEIAAGTLAGLLPGSQVEIHRAGSPKPRIESRLAQGVVITSTATSSTVALDRAIPGPALARARGFLTRSSFGGLSLRVEAKELSASLAAGIRQRVQQALPTITWVESHGDVQLTTVPVKGGEEIHAVTSAGVPIMAPLSVADNAEAIESLVSALGDCLRSRYLRRLDIRDAAFAVRLDLIPRVSGTNVWQVGQQFELTIDNRSKKSAYVSVLDLTPDGKIKSYWPDPRTGEKTEIPPKTRRPLLATYEMTEPLGEETLLLIASDEWIDFRPILSRAGVWSSGAAKGMLGPFSPLFDLSSVKGEAQFEPSKVATWAITGEVMPKRGER